MFVSSYIIQFATGTKAYCLPPVHPSIVIRHSPQMHHPGFHPQRAHHNYDHAYEHSFVNRKTLPSFSELTNGLFSECRSYAPHGPFLKPTNRYRSISHHHHSSTPPNEHASDVLCHFDRVNPSYCLATRPLTFEQVFNTNNYFNVVEFLDNKFHKPSIYSQTYHQGHHHDPMRVELEPETECYKPEVALDDIDRVGDQLGEWLKFVINIGKVDGKGPAIYQCLHHIEDKFDKNGQPVRSTCNYKGAKQTVKRHVNSVHFGRRPWVCEHCFKAFNQKSTLDIHVNARHTQIKPHKCRHCPERFTDPAKRHKHCLKDHPDIPMPRRRKAPYKSVSSSPRQVAALFS